MINRILIIAVCIITTLLSASCEHPMISADSDDDKEIQPTSDLRRVSFNVCKVDMIPFGNIASESSNQDVSQVCSRIELAIFNENKRIELVRQTTSDNNFGNITVDLKEGDYTVVVLAHNGDGNATITSPQEIKFHDNKVTDTFYYCGDITVDETNSYELTLKRAVAMFRLVVEDNIPEDVTQMKFYYTGGSSTFNAVSGYGCVNSRQTELRDVSTNAHNEASNYEIFTFPHSNGGDLKITVTALNDAGETIEERVFEDVPVECNQITQYTGTFFSASPGTGRSFRITINDSWSIVDYQY